MQPQNNVDQTQYDEPSNCTELVFLTLAWGVIIGLSTGIGAIVGAIDHHKDQSPAEGAAETSLEVLLVTGLSAAFHLTCACICTSLSSDKRQSTVHPIIHHSPFPGDLESRIEHNIYYPQYDANSNTRRSLLE